MSVRVVVADDHPVVRAGLVLLLGNDPDIEVIGEAEHGRAAVEMARAERPDVVMTDLQMPELDGVGVARELQGVAPVLVLTTYSNDRSIVAAMDAGAAGYLLKDAPPTEILDAVKAVASGRRAVPAPIEEQLAAAQAQQPLDELTEREVDVLRCVARGLANKAIAAELFVSVATVKTHLIHVFQKLQVDDRTAAVTRSIELGVLEAPGA